MKVLIIIPAYNEESNIVRVVTNIHKLLPDYDYVVINDGSLDNTAQVCRNNNFRLIDLPANLGLAGAFQTGMKYAWKNGYDAAIQFDGDGQHRAEYIPELVKQMELTDSDIVIGSRFVSKRKPFTPRMIGSRLLAFLIFCTTGKHLKDPTSGMRLYGHNVIKEYALELNYAPEPDTLAYLLNNGCKISEVQVKMDERQNGKSYLGFLGSYHYMFKQVISIVFVQWFRKPTLLKKKK
ncbi:MAG: glycosyltransferase family 2 protein [Treponema sp.]|nr:glycosyltransferase family 2 protein [Candidatus Treponema merdequi]